MEKQYEWGAVSDGWRKGPWTSQEDQMLIDHVKHHGEGKWNSVSCLTGLKRCGKSCRLRWVNYLRPGLKRSKISPHEEDIILQLHAMWGNRWSMIAKCLPGRTDNVIKNYWRTHFKNGKLTKSVQRDQAASMKQLKLQYKNQQEHEQRLLLKGNIESAAFKLAEQALMEQKMKEMACLLSGPLEFQTDAVWPGGSTASSEEISNDADAFCAMRRNLWSFEEMGVSLGDQALSFYY